MNFTRSSARILRAESRKDAARLAKARESERTAPLRAVDDPRDAAVILMLLMARVGGDPTREQIAAMDEPPLAA